MSDHFDDAAEAYSAMMRQPWHQLRLHSALANIRRNVDLTGHWFDLGAGTGEGSLLLAETASEVTVSDPAASMMSVLQTLAARSPAITAVPTDGLVALAETADGVLLHNVIEYAADRGALLGQAAAVLRPGGHVSVLCANPYAAVYTQAVRGASPGQLLATAKSNTVTVGLPDRRFTVGAYSIDDCLVDAAAHGLNLVAHRGVRVLSDLAPGHASQQSSGWLAAMLLLEDVLGSRDPFRASARHWHLILRKAAL